MNPADTLDAIVLSLSHNGVNFEDLERLRALAAQLRSTPHQITGYQAHNIYHSAHRGGIKVRGLFIMHLKDAGIIVAPEDMEKLMS